MSHETHSTALFDPDAFYPFRSLVEGPLYSLEMLPQIERFMRGIILHDEMRMHPEPWPAPEEEEEETEPGPRNVIVAIGPVLDKYEGLLVSPIGLKEESTVTLSENLLAVAVRLSGAGPGDPYYEAHVHFLQRLVDTVRDTGSSFCDGPVARAAEVVAMEYPEELFATLDQDWQSLAHALDAGQVGPALPPIVSTVLRRAKSREDIPTVLHEFRHALASPRRKVWKAITRLRSPASCEEAWEVKRELDAVSRAFSPLSDEERFGSTRVLWQVIENVVGAGAGLLTTGEPAGTVVGAAAAPIILEGARRLAAVLFGRSALDLGRRIRKEIMKSEPTLQSLSRLLSQSEKSRLGL